MTFTATSDCSTQDVLGCIHRNGGPDLDVLELSK